MIPIPLTKNRVALVDDDDYQLAMQYCWYFQSKPVGTLDTGYAAHGLSEHGKRTGMVYMHRLIMNAPVGSKVDHIDLDGLNNQRFNLRISTQSQNCANKGIRSDNTSGYKGVYRQDGKWTAEVSVLGKKIRRGGFPTALEAAVVYNELALQYFGEFARVNLL